MDVHLSFLIHPFIPDVFVLQKLHIFFCPAPDYFLGQGINTVNLQCNQKVQSKRPMHHIQKFDRINEVAYNIIALPAGTRRSNIVFQTLFQRRFSNVAPTSSCTQRRLIDIVSTWFYKLGITVDQ